MEYKKGYTISDIYQGSYSSLNPPSSASYIPTGSDKNSHIQ